MKRYDIHVVLQETHLLPWIHLVKHYKTAAYNNYIINYRYTKEDQHFMQYH